MIGTFWNLCRACPSVPVDKLHSEYRSTYRWHEYTGSRQDVVRRPPQNTPIGPSSCEPALHRRRKHPELAYRTHDFLLSLDGGTEHLLEKTVIYDRARSEERWGSSRQKSSPRSKSEGPPAAGQPSYRLLCSKGRDEFYSSRDKTDYYDDKANEEIGKPSAAVSKGEEKSKVGGTSEYKLQFAWPPVSTVISSGLSNICAPRKSISMNGIKSKGHIEDAVPVHRRTLAAKVANQKENQMILNGLPPAMEEQKNLPDPTLLPESSLKEFRSEYSKQFQPFYNYYFDENRGVFEKKDASVPQEILPNENPPIETQNSHWYKEVVLLRKKASQYRHRGWGTELVPEHIAQLYSDQINVWEQVSRRSSLSALSLATTLITKSPRSTMKEERDTRRSSPSKSLTRQRGAKSEIDGVSQKEKLKTAPTSAKGETSAPKSNTRLKTKSMVASPKTKRSTSRTREVKDSPRLASDGGPSPPITRRPRPTETEEDEFPQMPEEQLVKSPPEPTRVKSPEQIVMRSPEPVNWTVPLDTGKTFTVTQNIRDGEHLPRSLSEARAWTPSSQHPAPVSAPPELAESAIATR